MSILCNVFIKAGYHMRSNAVKKSIKMQSAGLFGAATIILRSSMRATILVCNLLFAVNPDCSSTYTPCPLHHFSIRWGHYSFRDFG